MIEQPVVLFGCIHPSAETANPDNTAQQNSRHIFLFLIAQLLHCLAGSMSQHAANYLKKSLWIIDSGE